MIVLERQLRKVVDRKKSYIRRLFPGSHLAADRGRVIDSQNHRMTAPGIDAYQPVDPCFQMRLFHNLPQSCCFYLLAPVHVTRRKTPLPDLRLYRALYQQQPAVNGDNARRGDLGIRVRGPAAIRADIRAIRGMNQLTPAVAAVRQLKQLKPQGSGRFGQSVHYPKLPSIQKYLAISHAIWTGKLAHAAGRRRSST